MNDITELAQLRAELSNPAIGSKDHLRKLALSLVEALEKAQQHIARQEQILLNQDESLSIRRGELEKTKAQSSKWLEAYHKAVSIGARYEERIAELEESNAQIIQSRDHYKRMTEEGLKQLAESRTVKLVDCDFGAVQHMSGGSTDYCHGFVDGTQNAIRAITAAGIKVEGE